LAARPDRFTPYKTPRTYWVGGLVGSRASLEPLEAGKISCPYQEPWFFSPWVSRYTDWATSAMPRLAKCVLMCKSICLTPAVGEKLL